MPLQKPSSGHGLQWMVRTPPMNPMMRTLLEELTQVRARRCQYPQLGWDCLRGPVIQSSAFGRGGWGQTLSRPSLTFQGQEGCSRSWLGSQQLQKASFLSSMKASSACLCCGALQSRDLTDTFWAAASRGGGSAVPCLSLSGQPSGQLCSTDEPAA